MTNLWKVNWAETKQHFIDWWNHEGLVLGSWGTGIQSNSSPHAHVVQPESPVTVAQRHTDPDFVAQNIRYEMAHKTWPADILPVAWPDIGTVSLCTYLGAIPEYTATNVWYIPCIHDPDSHPSLIFDPECSYCKILESVVRETVRQSQGNYFVGCPALVPNLDVLAELRGIERLLTDLIDRPQWVHEKLQEIDRAYVQAFDRMYELIKLPVGHRIDIHIIIRQMNGFLRLLITFCKLVIIPAAEKKVTGRNQRHLRVILSVPDYSRYFFLNKQRFDTLISMHNL